MSRGLRLIPIVLLIWFVGGLAWRLVKPADPAVPSQLVQREVPAFQLGAAVPGKPGLNSAELASGGPRLLNIFASWCVPCVGEAPVLAELSRRGVKIDAIGLRRSPPSSTHMATLMSGWAPTRRATRRLRWARRVCRRHSCSMAGV